MRLAILLIAFITPQAVMARSVQMPLLKHYGAVMVPDTTTEQTLFEQNFDGNGMAEVDPSVSWGIADVPAPSGCWFGADPTGSGSATTGTWTLAGSAPEVDTPFCPDGSWDDLSAGCMKGRYFDGTGNYYLNDISTVGDLDEDFTFITVTKQLGGNSGIASKADPGDNGWEFYVTGGGHLSLWVEDDLGASIYSTVGVGHLHVAPSNWFIGGFSVVLGGNSTSYVNGYPGTPAATPTGGFVVANEFEIGGMYRGSSYDSTGPIAVACWWEGTALSTAQHRAFADYFKGIVGSSGTIAEHLNAGPSACWIDGSIHAFSDNMPVLGCQVPPGMTGAGGPASSGLYSGYLLTQSLPYSADMGSWSTSGTPTVTATGTDLFGGGIKTDRVCDDDAGAVEYIQSSTFNISALDAADPIQFCVYAKDSSGTKIDAQIIESGVCGGSTTDVAAETIDTSWGLYSWTHTVADGTCTTATLRLSPTDFATASETGCAEIVVQAFQDRSTCPVTYIETLATGVAAIDDDLRYDISASDMIDGSGSLKTPFTVSFDYSPMSPLGSPYVLEFADSATSIDYFRVQIIAANGRIYTRARSTEQGSDVYPWYTNTATTFTPGNTYTIEMTISYVGSEMAVSVDGVPLTPTAVATLSSEPNSIDEICFGGLCGVSQIDSSVKNLRVVK